MASQTAVEVLALGMVTPVGLTAESTAAAARAQISRVRESLFFGRSLEPLVLGFLDERYLPPLVAPSRVGADTSERHERMLRLSGSALHEAARHGDGPMTCLLALPEPPLDGPNPIGESFLEDLSVQAGVELDLRRSRVFRQGRAGGLLALKQAVALLAERREAYVLVGGVDSHLDFQVLAELDAQERLRASSGPSDSFIPGEGAAFVLLGSLGSGRRLRIDPQAHLLGVGTGFEQGHRLSAHPHLGEGLADAFRVLFASLPPAAGQIRCVYAGLNGESFWAKDWGVAYQRNARRFAEQFHIEHPVEFLGDPGAALGPLMVGLATIGVRKGYREAPCLVWCASDQGACAAALIAGIR